MSRRAQTGALLLALAAAASIACTGALDGETHDGEPTADDAGPAAADDAGPAAGADADPPAAADAGRAAAADAGVTPADGATGLDPCTGVSTAGPSGLTQTLVSSAAELASAAQVAPCGHEIVLEDAAYDLAAPLVLAQVCSETAPLIIRSAHAFDVDDPSANPRFTGAGLDLRGSHLCVRGVFFSGPDAKIAVGGASNRVIGNKLTGWNHPQAITVNAGTGVEIAYNELSSPAPWSATPAGVSYPLRLGIRTAEKEASQAHQHGWIHHNHFHDFPAKPDPANYSSGQSDAIEICETARPGLASGAVLARWVIEYNLVEDHLQGHGTIDLKCGGNLVRHNTFYNAPGRIDARVGPCDVFEANWLENSGGIHLTSGYHRVAGNRLVGGGTISLMAGTRPWDYDYGAGSDPNDKQQAYRVEVYGNQGTLRIGEDYGGDWPFPAAYTSYAHTGPVELRNQEHSTALAAAPGPVPTAARLLAADVGLRRLAARQGWDVRPPSIAACPP